MLYLLEAASVVHQSVDVDKVVIITCKHATESGGVLPADCRQESGQVTDVTCIISIHHISYLTREDYARRSRKIVQHETEIL